MLATLPSKDTTDPPALSLKNWGKLGFSLIGSGLLLYVLWEAYRVFLGDNFHAAIPGKVYRGAQQSSHNLERFVKQHGIRTVVNLRGLCNTMGWYQEQCRTIQRLAINQQEVCFSAGRMPPTQELRRLIEILEHGEYPMFFHCRRGADRTGVACAVAMLLHPEGTVKKAWEQLHWRYGHVALGRPAYLDDFLDLYEAWLKEQDRAHTPAVFRHWALEEYQGGWCQYAMEEFARLNPPGPVPADQPVSYRVKLRNTGAKAWHLSAHGRAGYHLGYRIRNSSGKVVLEGRSGLIDQEVGPGTLLETTLIIPASLKPGRHRLMVDMVEERQGWFFQMGAEPWEEELEIRE